MQLARKELDGFESIELAVERLQAYMLHHQDKNILYVSHGAIITPYVSCLQDKESIEESEIVNYLDGFSIESVFDNFQSVQILPFRL